MAYTDILPSTTETNQLDIKVDGSNDFKITANKLEILEGSEVNFPSGSKIKGPGYVGKTMVISMIFGG